MKIYIAFIWTIAIGFGISLAFLMATLMASLDPSLIDHSLLKLIFR